MRSKTWLIPWIFVLALPAETRAQTAARKPFTVVEAGIPQMRAALSRRAVTSRELVLQYLTRIATYEDKFHAALTVNPHALEQADALNSERAMGRIRGPLHGIPIALKDNIHTIDMPTTGGALAFDRLMPPYEATLAKNLRAAGATIIPKPGMPELANWVAGPPTPMPANYNGLGGYGFNPYDPRRDPRDGIFDGRPAMNTGGSRSRGGTPAHFLAAQVGAENPGPVPQPPKWAKPSGIKPTGRRNHPYRG